MQHTHLIINISDTFFCDGKSICGLETNKTQGLVFLHSLWLHSTSYGIHLIHPKDRKTKLVLTYTTRKQTKKAG
jgi:hypothetical protein